MKNLILISFIICILSANIFSQLGYIPLNADYATFKGADNKSYTEVYLAFYQQDLQYELGDSASFTKFSHTLEIDQNDTIVYNITRNYSSKANANSSQSSQFIEVFPLELAPGDYNLKANVIDKVSNKSGEYNLELSIPNYADSLSISNIEIATKIDPKNDESHFSLKNNISIFPNVSKTFTIYNPIMYFYFECYNLLTDSNGNNEYSYTYNISDLKGNIVRDYPEKVNKGLSSAAAEANGINVIALPNGAHFLNIKLTDLNNNISVSQKKKFFINKPKREKSDKVIAAKVDGYEEYVNFTEDEVNTEFDQIKYICRSEEIDIFEKLDSLKSKKRFLSQFWAKRDSDPSTPINEYKQMYFENLRVVNENFSNQFKDGWRTDRGRVILIYGKPNEIERNPSTIDSQPYEIWYYYSLEGGSEFIFADLSGNGNYELLHSTFRNEIKDPDWQIRIQKLKSRGYDPSIDRF
jgi:GWxTD domain-containing protein